MKIFTTIALFILLGLSVSSSVTQAANRRVKICIQPMKSGRCFGYVPSFAYNPFERKCEEFVYGGCGGNENRFETKAECELNCRDI